MTVNADDTVIATAITEPGQGAGLIKNGEREVVNEEDCRNPSQSLPWQALNFYDLEEYGTGV